MKRFTALLRRFGPVLGITAGSQAVSALCLVVLPTTLGLAVSDAYALGIQTGLATLGGVVIGVVYNLAIGRPGFKHWVRSAFIACGISVTLAMGTCYVIFVANGDSWPDPYSASLVLIFGLGGAGLASCGVFAVQAACHGQPRPLAAVTIGPSVFLLASLLLTPALDLPVWIPAALWAFVAWAQLPAFLRVRREAPATDSDSSIAGSDRPGVHLYGLGLGAVTSTLMPNLYVSALTQLPPGSTTIAFLIGRIGTSIVGLGVNSVLLTLYNWRSKPRDIVSLTTWLVAAGFVPLLASNALIFVPALSLLRSALLILSWAIFIVTAAVVIREVNARRSSRAVAVKSTVDLVVSVSAAAALFIHPAINGYFAAYLISQTITIGVASFTLKSRLIGVLSLLSLVGAATGLING